MQACVGLRDRSAARLSVCGSEFRYVLPSERSDSDSRSAGGILQAGKFDVEFSSWVNGIDPDDSTVVTCDAFPPHGQNLFRFCNRELDAQERIALTYYDPVTRKRAYDRVQEILVDRLPWLTLWFQRRFDVASDDLRGYKPAHAVTTFWNTWEYSI